MPCEWHYVEEITYLVARAVLRGVDGDLQVQVRKLAAQPLHRLECGVACVMHAENDLQIRAVLLTERAQMLVEGGLRPTERVEDCRRGYRRRFTRCGRTYANTDGDPGEDDVRHGHGADNRSEGG